MTGWLLEQFARVSERDQAGAPDVMNVNEAFTRPPGKTRHARRSDAGIACRISLGSADDWRR